MKRILLILIFSYSAICSLTAQPEAVHNAFGVKFPNAVQVIWGNGNGTEWEADFMIDGSKYSALFDLQGKWIETIRIIKLFELPQDVRNSIVTNFPHWEIAELNKIEKANSGVSYEANLKKGKEKKNIAIKEDGSIIH